MSAPTLPKRVAVDHHLGLTPAIPPQIHKRKRLQRDGWGPSTPWPPPVVSVMPAAPSPAAPVDVAPWRLRLLLGTYRLSMGFGEQALSRLPRLFQRSPYIGRMVRVPTHTGVPPCGAFPLGTKQKFKLRNGERMAVLTDAGGKLYVVSQSQGRGGYGKLRVAMDFAGQHYAVKEMRLVSRTKDAPSTTVPSSVTRRQTKVSSPGMIFEEMAMMAAASRSMTVHTCFEVQGKVYLFLPLMADDASALATGTPGFARVAVGRQILLRTCEDLAAIHQRGYLHHDVKLHNILWNAAGAASLADFGLSCKVDEKTGTTRASGRTAGNMPLEYELGVPFSWSLDTFMLGLAMADYYAPQVREHPATGKAIDALIALEDWRTRVLDGAGRLDLARLGNLQALSPQACTWDDYFARVCAVDPVLGAFIVERMLNRQPAARASLAEVRTFVEGLQPPDGHAARAAVQVMRTIAINDWDRQRLLRHMRHFRRRVCAEATGGTEADAAGVGTRSNARTSSRLGRFWRRFWRPRQRGAAVSTQFSAAFWRKPPKRAPEHLRASGVCG